MLQSSLQTRLLTTSRTAGGALITAKRWTWTTLATALSSTEAEAKALHVALGQPINGGKRQRGVELSFFGSGADNATMTCRVWQLKWGNSLAANPPVAEFELAYLGSVAATLSTLVGASTSAVVSSTERIADTLVWTPGTASSTPKGISDAIESVYQSTASVVYNPADNTPARLFIPECGNGDIILEPYIGSATGANVVWESVT